MSQSDTVDLVSLYNARTERRKCIERRWPGEGDLLIVHALAVGSLTPHPGEEGDGGGDDARVVCFGVTGMRVCQGRSVVDSMHVLHFLVYLRRVAS